MLRLLTKIKPHTQSDLTNKSTCTIWLHTPRRQHTRNGYKDKVTCTAWSSWIKPQQKQQTNKQTNKEKKKGGGEEEEEKEEDIRFRNSVTYTVWSHWHSHSCTARLQEIKLALGTVLLDQVGTLGWMSGLSDEDGKHVDPFFFFFFCRPHERPQRI